MLAAFAVTVNAALLITNSFETLVAALYKLFPACLAMILTVPAFLIVTVVPETLAMFSSLLSKVTVKLEVDVALKVKVPSP
ncbi:hypothetical protein D3C85_881100 [compost metagenome]